MNMIDMLIDISDVLQICCYELGRTYMRLSQALCINIPSIGKCFNALINVSLYLMCRHLCFMKVLIKEYTYVWR